MITKIKVLILKLIDWLDGLYDPFEEFDRHMFLKNPGDPLLYAMADEFEKDLFGNFLMRNGTVVQYRLTIPPGGYQDYGDQALWHGIALAMLSMKFSVTKLAADATRIVALINGLVDHQPEGRLIRGLDETGTVTDNASNDQATGHLAGIYFAWRYGPTEAQPVLRLAILAWANHVLDHGYALVGSDGQPTTYGALDQGWKSDPLRTSLAMAIMIAAYKMTSAARFSNAFWDLKKKYGDLLRYAKVKLWHFDTLYDTHRTAIHLAIINECYGGLEADAGIRRLWKIEHKTGNAWVWALTHMRDPHTDPIGLTQCIKALKEFHGITDMTNSEHLNSTDPAMKWVKTIDWKGEPCWVQPVPRWKAVPQDFIWQRSVYALDKHGDADSRYSNLGFLTAYWMMRAIGALTADE